MTQELYKVVQSAEGPTIAHLLTVSSTTLVKPADADDSRVRADSLLVYHLENHEDVGWGPVDGRTVYQVGEQTEADNLDEDEETVSSAGLHAFEKREDAKRWMQAADI